jgi:hypothetical protein
LRTAGAPQCPPALFAVGLRVRGAPGLVLRAGGGSHLRCSACEVSRALLGGAKEGRVYWQAAGPAQCQRPSQRVSGLAVRRAWCFGRGAKPQRCGSPLSQRISDTPCSAARCSTCAEPKELARLSTARPVPCVPYLPVSSACEIRCRRTSERARREIKEIRPKRSTRDFYVLCAMFTALIVV